MKRMGTLFWLLAIGGALTLRAQAPDNAGPPRGEPIPPGFGGPPPDGAPGFDGPPPFGPGGPGFGGPGFGGPGFGGPGFGGPGFGGPGGPMQQERQLVKQFDQNGDGWLNNDERKAARQFLAQQPRGRGPGGFGGPRGGFGGRGGMEAAPEPGPKVSPADVEPVPNAPLYDPLTLRTLFLEFENADWEQELADFHNTDVEVPARLIVDGQTYPDVGVHFRGQTSYMFVSAGRKRPLNLSLDFLHADQRLGGYRTLNLLNAHEDPSLLRTVLFYHIAREYFPAPKANFVRVVINGESWGIYVNAQQINKDFTRDFFGSTKGARWKVPGSPGGRGGLEYLGPNVADYQRIYEIKSKDEPDSWKALIGLCQVLDETAPENLQKALDGWLDVDGVLRFLAVDNALVNNDGFWTRASDYYLYRDERGCFHLIPQDANETFSDGGGPGGPRGPGSPAGPGGFGPGRFAGPQQAAPAGSTADQRPAQDAQVRGGANPDFPPPGFAGPGGGRDGRGGARGRGGFGFGGGPGMGGVRLDPLVAANDTRKPVISKLLAVPAYRARYLGYVRDVAERWLDWNRLGPVAEGYHTLIAEAVKEDTRKLDSTEAFLSGLAGEVQQEGRGFGGGGKISLKRFAEERRAFLLAHPDVKAASVPQ